MPKGFPFPETRQILSSNARYARTLLGLNQEQLAELAELDRSQISNFERMASGASVDSIGRLAKAVGVPAHVLLMPPSQAHPLILTAIQSKKAAKEPVSKKKGVSPRM